MRKRAVTVSRKKKYEMGKKIMGKSVAETIRDLSKKIIDKNKAVVIGQCLSAVGWVQNTVPPQKKRNYRTAND